MKQKIITISLTILLLLASNVFAQSQMEIAEQLAAKCGFAQIGHDGKGKVTGLFLSHKNAYKEDAQWLGQLVKEIEGSKDAPQITDADMPLLLKLPDLIYLKFQGQMVSGEGYQLCAQMRQLEYLGLHTVDSKELTEAGIEKDPDCILLANQLPNLRRFDYKHNFRLSELPVDQLKGSDKMEYLMLDNALCESSVVPYILDCPKLNRLELHRTNITADDLRKIVATNTSIEDIRIRPQDDKKLQPADLKIIEDLPKLHTLCFGGNYNRMDFDYEKDLQFLTEMATLKTIVAPAHKKGADAFQKLEAAMSGISFRFGYY
ncbi:MAG: hypothetical protein ACLFUS_00895 [Candidatus Sumerlaeia bacterium]